MATSVGLDENLEGALAYLLGFVTGIVFLIIEKESKFVRFHAMQSTITFAGFWILSMILSYALIPVVGFGLFFLFSGIVMLINIAALITWLICMYKAYRGEWFKLPIVGDIAEQQIRG
uniref:DUF4870 domain-containing protein n=1 Tax=Archaeoglobus fulgidus TaxID=2234 RepID=A0A7C3RCD4_ARCFL